MRMYSLVIFHKDRRWRDGTSACVRLVNGIIWRKHFIGLEPFAPANVVSILEIFDPA